MGMRLVKRLARLMRAGSATPLSEVTPPPAPPVANDRDRYFYLGPDAAITRLVDGHFLFVDPQDETVSSHLIGRGFWETWIQQAICSCVKPGDQVIEVGSNAGSHTMAIARAVGPTGRVIAVEANPRLAGLLKRSIEYNGYANRVVLYQGAADDKEGSKTFMTSRRNGGGGHTLVYEGIFGADTVAVEVPAIPLSILVPEPVDFIRLDAEGSEPQILAGADIHLANPDILLCMEWDVFQMSMRTSVPAFVDSLVQQGFLFWRIETDGSLTRLPNEGMAELAHCEIFASRKDPRVRMSY